MKAGMSKKGKIMCAVAAAVFLVAAGIILYFFVFRKDYRIISVSDLTGKTLVSGEKNKGDAYKGQRFYEGDVSMRLLLFCDKNVI